MDDPENQIGVYLILNSINMKVYVGSATRSFKLRWNDHRRALRGGYHTNCHLQAAWNKYGEDVFDFSIIEVCLVDDCVSREQHYIDAMDAFKSGYNRSPTTGSTLGIEMSEEVRKKMSERMSGVPMKDEVKKKISNALKGRQFSDEHKAAIGAASEGRMFTEESRKKKSDTIRKLIADGKRLGPPEGWKHSEETRKKMSKAGKGRPKSESHKAKIAAALKGKKRSAAHCAAISLAKRKLT